LHGTLSGTFLELVAKAEHLVLLVDFDMTKVPCKPNTKPAAKQGTPEDGDLLAMFAKQIDTQQESIKQILSMLASNNNQLKQFKANYSKHDSPAASFDKTKRCMPPWMDKKPTNPKETRTWDDRPWYYCASCKQGRGGWSLSNSTKGDAKKGISAHHGGKPPYKRDSPNEPAAAPVKKKA
jgi:hypothetical protein